MSGERWTEICGWCGQLAAAGLCTHDHTDPAKEGMHDTIESEADSRHESEAMTATEYAQLDAEARWARHVAAVGTRHEDDDPPTAWTSDDGVQLPLWADG